MGMTICEKILARASGREAVRPGDYLWAAVDGTAVNDGRIAQRLRELGIKSLFDPSRIFVTDDHYAPPPTAAAAEAAAELRRFVHEFHVPNYFECGRHGVMHELFPHFGYVSPGDLIASIDSHSTSYGCFNAAACSIGEELPYVLGSGRVWLKVPETVTVVLRGSLPSLTTARDAALHLAALLGNDAAAYRALEFRGCALAGLSISDRLCLAATAAELGAKFAVFPYDSVLEQFLREKLRRPARPVEPDSDAWYERHVVLDLDDVEPLLALPGDPCNIAPVAELAAGADVSVAQVFIGSCANGRFEDFEAAARVLKGRKLHPAVRLIATPASQEVWKRCLRAGIWEIFAEADAVITNSTCGACAGVHMGLLAGGEVCISTGTRNYIGRMGSPGAEIYLASPVTAAACAVAGRLIDPRELCGAPLLPRGRCPKPREAVAAKFTCAAEQPGAQALCCRVWTFGDDISTDVIMPGAAVFAGGSGGTAPMESVRPRWTAQISQGDVIVAGRNFGCGSGRPAPRALQELGIAAVIAESFARTFFRNAVHAGLPVLTCPGAAGVFCDGDAAEIDFARGLVKNCRTGDVLQGEQLPDGSPPAVIAARGGIDSFMADTFQEISS